VDRQPSLSPNDYKIRATEPAFQETGEQIQARAGLIETRAAAMLVDFL